MDSGSQGVVGFLGLDEVSLELAAFLLRSGYAVQAFQVCLSVEFVYCFQMFDNVQL